MSLINITLVSCSFLYAGCLLVMLLNMIGAASSIDICLRNGIPVASERGRSLLTNRFTIAIARPMASANRRCFFRGTTVMLLERDGLYNYCCTAVALDLCPSQWRNYAQGSKRLTIRSRVVSESPDSNAGARTTMCQSDRPALAWVRAMSQQSGRWNYCKLDRRTRHCPVGFRGIDSLRRSAFSDNGK
jgi:hypothetical protein